ncbi:hypothetical protein STEG23_014651, partial [Scotinomys teguina]
LGYPASGTWPSGQCQWLYKFALPAAMEQRPLVPRPLQQQWSSVLWYHVLSSSNGAASPGTTSSPA